MDVVVERCAGLDVHKDTVVACVRSPGAVRRREETIVTFGTTTVQLLALRDWLVAMGVTLVGMESTGVYWKPVYFVLEDAVECWLLNAQHLRTCRAARPTWPTRRGSASWSSTDWSAPASCRPARSVSCATCAAIAARRSKNAPGNSSGWTRCCKTPGSSCPRWRLGSWACRGGRCSTRSSPAPAIPTSWPSWPKARCARRSPSCVTPCRAASVPITGC
jgi:hypothetical protein